MLSVDSKRGVSRSITFSSSRIGLWAPASSKWLARYFTSIDYQATVGPDNMRICPVSSNRLSIERL